MTDQDKKDIASARCKRLKPVIKDLMVKRSAYIAQITAQLHKIDCPHLSSCTTYDASELKRAINSLNNLQERLVSAVHEYNEQAAISDDVDFEPIKYSDIANAGVISLS